MIKTKIYRNNLMYKNTAKGKIYVTKTQINRSILLYKNTDTEKQPLIQNTDKQIPDNQKKYGTKTQTNSTL